MAGAVKNHSLTYISGANLSASAFLFGKISSAKIVVAGAGEQPEGIIQENPPNAADLGVELGVGTTSKLVVNGGGTPIAYGDFLKSDASGRGIKASAGDLVGAKALAASTGISDIIEVRVLPPGLKAP
jgi:hypothetical protein